MNFNQAVRALLADKKPGSLLGISFNLGNYIHIWLSSQDNMVEADFTTSGNNLSKTLHFFLLHYGILFDEKIELEKLYGNLKITLGTITLERDIFPGIILEHDELVEDKTKIIALVENYQFLETIIEVLKRPSIQKPR